MQLRQELDDLKVRYRVETDKRKAAEKWSRDLQMKNDKLRLRGNKKGKYDVSELEEIQVFSEYKLNNDPRQFEAYISKKTFFCYFLSKCYKNYQKVTFTLYFLL